MSEKAIIIEGGRKLVGEVRLSGAKNAALPILVAACLGHEPSIIENVPVGLRDVRVMIKLLKSMGADVEVKGTSVVISRGDMNSRNIPLDCSKRIRSFLLLLGLFLGLGMDVFLPESGGCNSCEDNHGFYGETCSTCGKPKITTYQRIVINPRNRCVPPWLRSFRALGIMGDACGARGGVA